MAFPRWRAPRGKAGPLARAGAIHAAADAHARARPHLKVRTPTTPEVLSQMLGEMAQDLQLAMTRRIQQAFAAGVPPPSQAQAMRDDLRALRDEWLGVARPNIRDAIEWSYYSGKAGVAANLGSGRWLSISFTKPDRFAMQAIMNDTFRDVAGQTQVMLSSAVSILRTTAGAIIRREITAGTNPRRVAKVLEAELAQKGFSPSEALDKYIAARNVHRNPVTGALPQRKVKDWREAIAQQSQWGELKFIDRAGREWDLQDYTRMLARTKLSIAKNEGAVLAMMDADVNHYTVSDHGTESEVCEQYEGETFWTGQGDSLGYPQAPTLPPYHPNCWHYVIPAVLVKPKGKQ